MRLSIANPRRAAKCLLLACLAACDQPETALKSSEPLDVTRMRTSQPADVASEAGSGAPRAAPVTSSSKPAAPPVTAAMKAAPAATMAAAPSPAAPAAPSAAASAQEDAGEPTSPTGRPAGVADCYTADSSTHPATLEFWRVMHEGDYAARDAAIEKLAAASAAHPKEEQFALLHAHANMWRAAERQTVQDALGALDSTRTAEREFKRAYALCPTDHRVPVWLGTLQMLLGRLTSDPALVDEGAATLDQALKLYPFFAQFGNVIGYADLPKTDPLFMRALDTARGYSTKTADYCRTSQDAICENSGDVPHNLDGLYLYIGDVLAKGQDRAGALEAYTAARDHAGDSWMFRQLVLDRIRDLDARMQSAANSIALDDHESAWSSTSQCSYCHRR